MLKELYIKDLALIDELRAEFAPGFNVLTGETGAGKSILIDALNLVLGGRWEEAELRSGSDEALVEAAFEVEGVSQVAKLLEAEGILQEPGEYLVLRRQLLREGRSKAYINGRLSSAATLRALRGFLVDIYGQGQASSLLSPRKHLYLLDAYADLVEEVRAFRGLYERLRQFQRELDELLSKEREKEKRQDLLEYQRKEIDAARLQEGEEEELLAERAILSNVERLYEAAEGAYSTLYAEEGSILDQLFAMASKLKEASRIDPRLQDPLESLETARLSLEEAASALRDYRERVQFDPARLDAVEERLHEIGRLKRKYGSSIAEILRYREEIVKELEGLERSEERIQTLEREIGTLERELRIRASALSSKRAEAAKRLREEVLAELRVLSMPHAAFEVRITEETLGPAGVDSAEFFVSYNPGEELKPLQKVASGGELSRTMLGIKTILAASDEIPTLVFDEVDVGIGGGMAEVVGRKLFACSLRRQVLSVTHLPQIAAFATAHFLVFKRAVKGRAEVALERLDQKRRVEELARMLGGKGRAIPLQHAEEILERAERWKRDLIGHRPFHEMV